MYIIGVGSFCAMIVTGHFGSNTSCKTAQTDSEIFSITIVILHISLPINCTILLLNYSSQSVLKCQ